MSQSWVQAIVGEEEKTDSPAKFFAQTSLLSAVSSLRQLELSPEAEGLNLG